MRIDLRPRALTDLEEIYRFSLEHWGTGRAESYIKRIDEAFRHLCDHPRLGQGRDDVLPGILAFRVLSHVIFYRHGQDGIAVIRVLHQAMDSPGALGAKRDEER